MEVWAGRTDTDPPDVGGASASRRLAAVRQVLATALDRRFV
jgi:hypothetical protein